MDGTFQLQLTSDVQGLGEDKLWYDMHGPKYHARHTLNHSIQFLMSKSEEHVELSGGHSTKDPLVAQALSTGQNLSHSHTHRQVDASHAVISSKSFIPCVPCIPRSLT